MAKQHQGAGPGPLAGEPRERPARERISSRVLVWVAWWVVLMALWLMLDDSFSPDEVIFGGVAAVLGATLAATATGQAGERFRLRPAWLRQAAELPGQVARDTVIVFVALARTLATGRPPRSEFIKVPVRYGDDTAYGATRRILLTWARSVAPNSFAVRFEPDRDAMLVHRLTGPWDES